MEYLKIQLKLTSTKLKTILLWQKDLCFFIRRSGSNGLNNIVYWRHELENIISKLKINNDIL